MKNTRKIIYLTAIIFFYIITLQVFGQANNTSNDETTNTKSYKVYGGIGIGLGFPCSLGIAADVLGSSRKEKHSIGLHLSLLASAPISKNLPNDFEGLFLPRDELNLFSAMLAYEYSDIDNTELGISFGPAILSGTKFLFTEYDGGWFNLTNYKTSEKQLNEICLSARIKYKFSQKKHVGTEIALNINVNSYSPIIGLEFYFIFGKI